MTESNLSLNIQVSAEIVLPEVPVELKLTNGAILKVSEMTENSLKKIASSWTKALLANCKKPIPKKPKVTKPAKGTGVGNAPSSK